MSDDYIDITVDGQPLKARKGQMLIEVTDGAGIDVPRFCYHKKLSVAANCRMCLVDVEKAPKPVPACATPVMPDMIVRTRSKLARDAQKSTMEFLLINHPLDCPVCDQGGECELQDVAMGYGEGVGQYTEGKRVVFDKYIGPLISTHMTRCIHCTRCVRFGEEVAGVRELGATGRGENMRIGTYIEKSVISEVSGNVIDICPVGALTARPSRFTARSWELRQQPTVSPHDSVGTNLFVHLDGNTVNRVVPRENESVNEVWCSDRDRFSYPGLVCDDRLRVPLVRDDDGQLVEVDWSVAIERAAALLEHSGEALGVLASPSLSIEELYLVQKLGRALGSADIDHRLGQVDFDLDAVSPVMPWLGMQIPDLETLDAALLVGSNIRKDQPIAALRLRKATLGNGLVSFLNPRRFPLHFSAYEDIAVRYDLMLGELVAIARAAGANLDGLRDLPDDEPATRHRRIAESLDHGERAAVMLGNIAVQHPAYARLRLVASRIAVATNATLAYLPERANTAGAWLAGVVPHREPGGKPASTPGRHARAQLTDGARRFLLVGVEVERDAANPAQAQAALANADAVVAISAYLSDSLRAAADVILPSAVFTETFGTYVNAAGTWQNTRGHVPPLGSARPGWKILRVLAEALSLDGFDYDSPDRITQELQAACADVVLDNSVGRDAEIDCPPKANGVWLRAGEIPIHAVDPVVRRSGPLQSSFDGRQAWCTIAPSALERLGLADGDEVSLRQHDAEARLPLRTDAQVPDGCVWVPSGLAETAGLGELFGPIEIAKS